MKYLILFIVLSSYACQPFTNKVSELALDCGPEAKNFTGEFVKLEDPNGQTPNPDSVEAVEVDLKEQSPAEVKLPITSRSCLVLPDQRSQIIVLRSADRQRNWGFVASREQLSFFKTIRLKKLVNRSIDIICPKDPLKEVRTQFAFQFSENVEETELFIRARNLKDTPIALPLSFSAQRVTIGPRLSEGEHNIEFSIHDLLLNSAKDEATKKVECSLTIDRTSPQLNTESFSRSHIMTIPSGSLIPLKVIDANPKIIRYCLARTDSQTCTNSPNWTAVSNSDITLEAPLRGVWKLFVEAIDAAGNSTQLDPFELRISQEETLNKIKTHLSSAQISGQTDTLQAQVNILRAFKEYDELFLDEERAKTKAQLINKAIGAISSYHENLRIMGGKDSSIASNDLQQKAAWFVNKSSIHYLLADGTVSSTYTFDFGEKSKPILYLSADNLLAAVLHENSKKISVFWMNQSQIQFVGTIGDQLLSGITELQWLGDSHSFIAWRTSEQENLASIFRIHEGKLSLQQNLPQKLTTQNSQPILFHKISEDGKILISYEEGLLTIFKRQSNGFFALQNRIPAEHVDTLTESIKALAFPRPFLYEQKSEEGRSDFYIFASESVFVWRETSPNIISQAKLSLEDLSTQETQCFKGITVNRMKFEEFFKKVSRTTNRYLSKCEKVGWLSLYLEPENIKVVSEFALSMPSSATNSSLSSKEYLIRNTSADDLRLVQILDQTQVNVFDLKNSNGFLSFQKKLSFQSNPYEVIYPNLLGRDFVAKDSEGFLRFISLKQPQSITIPSALSSLTWRKDKKDSNTLVTTTDSPTIKTWNSKGELLKTYSIQYNLLPANPVLPSLDWSEDGGQTLISFPWGQMAIYSGDDGSTPITFPKLPDITELSEDPESESLPDTPEIQPVFKAIGNADFSKIFAISGAEMAIWKKNGILSSNYKLESKVELTPYDDSDSFSYYPPRRYEARWIETGSRSTMLVSHGSRLQNIDFIEQDGGRKSLISHQDDVRASLLDRSGSTLIVQRKGGKLSAFDLSNTPIKEIAIEGLSGDELVESLLFSAKDDQLYAVTSNKSNSLTLHRWSKTGVIFEHTKSKDMGQKISPEPKHLEWSQALGGLVLFQEGSFILGLNSNLAVDLKIPTVPVNPNMRVLFAANPSGTEIAVLNPQGNFVIVSADLMELRRKYCTSIRDYLENISDEDWLLESDRKLCK